MAATTKTTIAKKATPARKAAPAKAAPAKTPRPRKAPAAQRVQVDDRLKTMSSEAVLCRSFGHALLLLPVPGPEAVKHRRGGQKLVLLGCRNQCGYQRRIVLDAGTKETISDHTKYDDPKSYLVQQRGAGRIRRHESRNAYFELVAPD